MTLVWRSMQYVPAHREKFLSSEKIRHADAFIIDLEDAVPPSVKAAARENVEHGLNLLGRWNGDLLVRINAEAGLAEPDIHASVTERTRALVLPKIQSAAQIADLEAVVLAAEIANGVVVGSTGLVVLIEDAIGLLNMAEILKASPRILAINLGNEDLAADLRVEPTEEALRFARQSMVIHACAAKVLPLGLAGRATGFEDMEAYRDLALRSRSMGSVGSTCIHPQQIPVLNAVFSPTQAEIEQAERVLQASEGQQGGAFALDGRMIDAPILARARQVLSQCEQIVKKSTT